MSATIYDLDINQLYRLKKDVDARVKELEDVESRKKLESEIEEYGYALRKKSNQTEYPYLLLYLNAEIWTMNIHNKNDSEDWHMDSDAFNIEQPAWTKRIPEWEDIDFTIKDVENVDNWEYGDWDDPVRGVGRICVHLYYKRHPKPAAGTTIEAINENGEIVTLSGDDYTTEEWSELEICVLLPN